MRSRCSASPPHELRNYDSPRFADTIGEAGAVTASSKAAGVTLNDVGLDADAVVGEVDDGWTPLARALSAGRAGHDKAR